MRTIFRTERQALIFMIVAGAIGVAMILTGVTPDIG
jgi:hypothetical protein